MLITGFPAGMFQTNCYVAAGGPGSDAVVIDPGQDAAPTVRELLAEHDLTPVAVLLTHGHLDHTWNATRLCDEYSIPAYIHAADRPMFADPTVSIGRALGAMIGDENCSGSRRRSSSSPTASPSNWPVCASRWTSRRVTPRGRCCSASR